MKTHTESDEDREREIIMKSDTERERVMKRDTKKERVMKTG